MKNGRQNGKALQVVENQVLFWNDYKEGMTYAQIAQKYKVSQSTVANEIRQHLQNLRLVGIRNINEYRQVQMERIQAAYKAIWPNIERGKTEAVNTMIRLMEREAKLLGLDAPAKVDITTRIQKEAEALGVPLEEAMDIAEGVWREVSTG